MLTKVYGAALQGIDATIVTIEVNSSRGIKFFLVGLPDSAVKESHERIISALQVNGYKFPSKQIVINMAPGDYYFDTDDYSDLRYYNWRSNAYNAIKDRYLLDVGFCPVTINGNGAVIRVGGNDDNDDVVGIGCEIR